MGKDAMTPPESKRGAGRANAVVATACGAFVVAMVGAAFAAVPLYEMFCAATGYGGTTSRADEGPGRIIDREFVVSFDANVRDGLPWRFTPSVRSVRVKAGEVVEVMFTAENTAAKDTVATSTFNVTPGLVGSYFSKIQCFCFTEQVLKPGEKRELPVVFFVDPSIDEDADLKTAREITLSYTFFPAKASQPLAAAAAPAASVN